MELRLTEQEALTLYRIILRWDELGSLTTEDDEERQLLWNLSCTLEKELEPVDEAVRRRLLGLRKRPSVRSLCCDAVFFDADGS